MHQNQDNKPSSVKVTIARDKLTATVSLLGSQDFVAVDEIYQALDTAGVKFGIEEEAVVRFSVSPSKEPVVVARGVPPVPGCDGYAEVLFEKKKPMFSDAETDIVDFRETSTLISVEAGEKLVEVHPPGLGMEGIAVTGEAVEPPPPKEIKLQAGRGVVLDPDGTRAFAQISGRPWIKAIGQVRIINCEPVYVHNGDVDIKTGNIRFKGDVRILGNVCETMEVHATGGIEVNGLATMARLISGGKIVVHGNVISSRLRAGILFPGAKKLGFMMADIHSELQEMAKVLDLLKSRNKLTSFDPDVFSRVVLKLMDSQFGKIRPMVKSIQAFVKNKKEELPQEIVEAVNSLSCFSGIRPLNEQIFNDVVRGTADALEMIDRNKGEDGAGAIIRSAVSSVIQCAGNVTVTGQGCVNTNITAGGNVYIKGSFKGGEILCEGSVEINELGSSLGAPPVVRVADGSTIKIRKAHEGSVLQVGNRRVTLTMAMESFRARLNKEDQLELY